MTASEMTAPDRTVPAINPLPWFVGPNGIEVTTEKLSAALRDLSPLGYRAVSSRIPDGMSESAYLAVLSDWDIRPAPGYFSTNFELVEDRNALVEQAQRHGASEAALGLTESFVGSAFMANRLAHPAVGYESSTDQTARVAELLAVCADTARAEGVTLALHPHVSSAVETEAEVRAVLDQTSGSALGFGPDTGHLAWAGANTAALFADYADRIVALHLKDVDRAIVRGSVADQVGYFVATKERHLWTEPGRGETDFGALLGLLPAAFSGCFVVEVDVPNLPSAVESSEFAYRYVSSLLTTWSDART